MDAPEIPNLRKRWSNLLYISGVKVLFTYSFRGAGQKVHVVNCKSSQLDRCMNFDLSQIWESKHSSVTHHIVNECDVRLM